MHLRHHQAVADGCMPVCREWQKALHAESTLHNSSWCPLSRSRSSFAFLLLLALSRVLHTHLFTRTHPYTHSQARTHTHTHVRILAHKRIHYILSYVRYTHVRMTYLSALWTAIFCIQCVCNGFLTMRASLFLSSAQPELDELYRARQLPV